MALGDVFKVTFQMVNDDKLVETAIHYEETVATVGSQAEVTRQLGDAAEVKFWTDFWQAFAATQLVFRQTICQQIFPTRQAPAFGTDLQDEIGLIPVPSMNGTTAVIVALYGQIWSPNFRGRGFLPGLPEDFADVGRIKAANLAGIKDGAETFYEAAITLPAPADGGFLPVVFSPTLAGPPPIPPVSDFIDTVIVRPRIGTQKSRRTPVQSSS